MTIDPYSPCPGGTGKKIKFCCSDLVHELDKLQRMIDGDQRVAGLDYVAKLDAKYPGRACLLATKAMLEGTLGNRDQSAATLATFREKHPENPLALVELAMHQVTGDQPADALATIERAIEMSSGKMSPPLYEALGEVAKNLAQAGHLVPAQALLWFQMMVSQGQDKQALQDLARIESDPAVAIFLKDQFNLEPTPPGAPWKYEFDLALNQGRIGHWQVAANKFAALIPIAGQSPGLWLNLARLRSWLADYAGAVEAHRKYASLDVPLDQAVEAEATAIQLEIELRALSTGELPPGPGDQLLVTFAVNSQTSLEERFAADRQLDRLPVDPRMWNEARGDQNGNQPPPRAAYLLSDRPIPPADGLKAEQIPLSIATLMLFGRQTDRPEHLDLVVLRSDLPVARANLGRIGGDALGDVTEERVVSPGPTPDGELSWRWRFPDGVPAQRRTELARSERRRRLLEVWPATPLNTLNGQTPRQAAADPGLRRRVLALILMMESSQPAELGGNIFDELRQGLGLPIPSSIDPATVDVEHLPRLRIERLQVDKLSDERLLMCYARAGFPSQSLAMVRLAKEVVARSSLTGKAEVAMAYGTLADHTSDSTEALAYVEKARDAARQAKQSTAPWDLEELALRLRRDEGAEFSRLLQHLQREHAREPGVAEAMFRILYEAGIIDDQGRPIAPPPPQGSPILVPGAPAPGKILVPGGESSPAAAGQSSKPVIWTPGMD